MAYPIPRNADKIPAVLTWIQKSIIFYSNKKASRIKQREAYYYIWWAMTGSNCRHPACKAGALPAELIARIW